jgi:hypothetical protein
MSETKINTAVPPETHPAMLDPLVGEHIAEDHPVIAAGRDALSAMYDTLGKIRDARNDLDAFQRAGLTPINFAEDNLAARGLNVSPEGRVAVARSPNQLLSEAGTKAIEQASARADRAMATLVKQEEFYEGKIDEVLRDLKYGAQIHAEARGWLRSLPEAERFGRIHEAARSGDLAMVAAVLGAPAQLSGLTEEQRTLVREAAARKVDPHLPAQRDAARRAQEIIRRAGAHLIGELASLEDYKRSPQARINRKIEELVS